MYFPFNLYICGSVCILANVVTIDSKKTTYHWLDCLKQNTGASCLSASAWQLELPPFSGLIDSRVVASNVGALFCNTSGFFAEFIEYVYYFLHPFCLAEEGLPDIANSFVM